MNVPSWKNDVTQAKLQLEEAGIPLKELSYTIKWMVSAKKLDTAGGQKTIGNITTVQEKVNNALKNLENINV